MPDDKPPANPSPGYTSCPTVIIPLGEDPGSGATATATITNGVITGITIVTPDGNGYTDPLPDDETEADPDAKPETWRTRPAQL